MAKIKKHHPTTGKLFTLDIPPGWEIVTNGLTQKGDKCAKFDDNKSFWGKPRPNMVNKYVGLLVAVIREKSTDKK